MVAFEAELGFEGPECGFYALTQRAQEFFAWPGFFVLCDWAYVRYAQVVEIFFELVAKGFGITTHSDGTGELASDSDWVDPNLAIVAALSESDRSTYYDTLHGVRGIDPDTGEPAETGVLEFDDLDGSCTSQAYKEVFAFFSALEQLDFESLQDRVMADPRTQTLYEEWSACMSGEGYEYENPKAMSEQVSTDLLTRLGEIKGITAGDPSMWTKRRWRLCKKRSGT